jgi:hypothetical protein
MWNSMSFWTLPRSTQVAWAVRRLLRVRPRVPVSLDLYLAEGTLDGGSLEIKARDERGELRRVFLTPWLWPANRTANQLHLDWFAVPRRSHMEGAIVALIRQLITDYPTKRLGNLAEDWRPEAGRHGERLDDGLDGYRHEYYTLHDAVDRIVNPDNWLPDDES